MFFLQLSKGIYFFAWTFRLRRSRNYKAFFMVKKTAISPKRSIPRRRMAAVWAGTAPGCSSRPDERNCVFPPLAAGSWIAF